MPLPTFEGVPTTLANIWRLPWDNRHKEVLFLLAHDGIPTAARMHSDSRCACGSPRPGRLRHFWHCPVAQAALRSLTSCLPPDMDLPRSALWLARPAPDDVHAGAWEVASLCALCAMDHRRRAGWRRLQEGAQPGPALVPALERSAAARFWALLADFCAVRAVHRDWQRPLSRPHPFFRYSRLEDKWCLRRP